MTLHKNLLHHLGGNPLNHFIPQCYTIRKPNRHIDHRAERAVPPNMIGGAQHGPKGRAAHHSYMNHCRGEPGANWEFYRKEDLLKFGLGVVGDKLRTDARLISYCWLDGD